MNIYHHLSEARSSTGWNDKRALFFVLDFIESLIRDGKITGSHFNNYLVEAQRNERGATLENPTNDNPLEN